MKMRSIFESSVTPLTQVWSVTFFFFQFSGGEFDVELILL